MIVEDDDRRGRSQRRFPKHVARLDHRRVQRPDRDDRRPEYACFVSSNTIPNCSTARPPNAGIRGTRRSRAARAAAPGGAAPASAFAGPVRAPPAPARPSRGCVTDGCAARDRRPSIATSPCNPPPEQSNLLATAERIAAIARHPLPSTSATSSLSPSAGAIALCASSFSPRTVRRRQLFHRFLQQCFHT